MPDDRSGQSVSRCGGEVWFTHGGRDKKLKVLVGCIENDAFGEDCKRSGHRNCLNLTREINVKMPGGKAKPLTITRHNWTDVIDEVHRLDPNMPDWQCVLQYSVCPRGVVTPLSYELFELYRALGGTSRVATIDDYNRLPAIYIDACNVIGAELARIKKERDGSE